MTFSIPQIGKSLALAALGGSLTITAGALILGLGSSAAGTPGLPSPTEVAALHVPFAL